MIKSISEDSYTIVKRIIETSQNEYKEHLNEINSQCISCNEKCNSKLPCCNITVCDTCIIGYLDNEINCFSCKNQYETSFVISLVGIEKYVDILAKIQKIDRCLKCLSDHNSDEPCSDNLNLKLLKITMSQSQCPKCESLYSDRRDLCNKCKENTIKTVMCKKCNNIFTKGDACDHALCNRCINSMDFKTGDNIDPNKNTNPDYQTFLKENNQATDRHIDYNNLSKKLDSEDNTALMLEVKKGPRADINQIVKLLYMSQPTLLEDLLKLSQ